MPGTISDSRRIVHIDDRRDRRSRPSYDSHDRYSNIDGERKSAHPHSHSRSDRDDKLSREKQWLQNSNSAKSATNPDPDEPPPAHHEAIKVPAPSSRARSSPGLSVQPITALPRLQLPVIIPQNPRDGGFCRAYTPLLEECKVSEAAFFYFLDDFDRSVQASPYFSAVNIASIGSLNRPYSTAMIVALARKRINTFLDRVNAEFFQPRGLFSLIVTWRPDINKTHETVNIEDSISSASMRSLPFPKSAHLTFPRGDPTENMEPQLEPDYLLPSNMYGPTSPAFGRGAGIPRLAGADPRYAAGVGYNDPYMMDRGLGDAYGRGGMGMGMEMGRMGGFGGIGGMGMGGHHRGRRGFGGGGGGAGGSGGLIGLAASFIEDKMLGSGGKSSSQSQFYDGGDAPGYMGMGMACGVSVPSRGSDTKAFRKDAIYLMVVNLPSDDELARLGASYQG